jgi:hypothetical protein
VILAAPNPVALRAWQDPAVWLAAVTCLAIEVAILRAAFRALGHGGAAVQDRLLLLQFVSWLVFLGVLDLWSPAGDLLPVAALEVLVVLAEAAALRCFVVPRAEASRRPSWAFAFGWSFLGNLASCALCAGVVAGITAWARWRL